MTFLSAYTYVSKPLVLKFLKSIYKYIRLLELIYGEYKQNCVSIILKTSIYIYTYVENNILDVIYIYITYQ